MGKRNDGKDAKFEASNCDWVKSNKMGCSQACSCIEETAAFADVKCIGPNQYMCTRDDGQQAKFAGTHCDWIAHNKRGCKLAPKACPCQSVVSKFSEVLVSTVTTMFVHEKMENRQSSLPPIVI